MKLRPYLRPDLFQFTVCLLFVVAGRHLGAFDRSRTTDVKTPTGSMRVSDPETTAWDLVRYSALAGGLGNVATVLSELTERIDRRRLVQTARRHGDQLVVRRLGYLLAQVVAAVLLSGGGLAGLSLNYSSSAAVGACVIVIVAVMASSLYPARRASELSVPDVTRRWTLPKAEGDRLAFDFPFTVGDVDLVGLFTYLADLFKAFRDSSIGSFAADDVRLSRKPEGMVLSMTCWLAPYDLGISQRATFETHPMSVGGLHRIHVTLERLSGEAGSWHRQNRRFLSALRKRFLVWRMFGPEQKDHYTLRGHALSVEPLGSGTSGGSRPADARSGPALA
ncbi:MAG: type IV toxin-antitoxin system AbiEi family antitoxin [bacterium]